MGKLSVIEGGIVNTPEQVNFLCHHCERPAVMHPLAKPINVMHSIRACDEWKRIEAEKEDLARYLIKCGVHVHVPGSEV